MSCRRSQNKYDPLKYIYPQMKMLQSIYELQDQIRIKNMALSNPVNLFKSTISNIFTNPKQIYKAIRITQLFLSIYPLSIIRINIQMTDTVRNEEDKVEYFDPPEVLIEKAKKVAKLITQSKYFISFTGAGISTSSGIPDFRSGMNTVLKTGPGVWEKRANNFKEGENKNIIDRNRAIPSFTHMALVTLEKQKLLKYLVSQNTDGLHLRSGFNQVNLSQLHGNRMLEKCRKCKNKYLRDFITREAKKALDHETSRNCQNCGEKLYDSIINFGQNLPELQLDQSYKAANKADLCLALGSSLTVKPACQIPRIVGQKKKLIVVNLQKTPLDNVAFIKVNSMCDDFMRIVMDEIKLNVEPFILSRYLQFSEEHEELAFKGVDRLGTPFSFLKNVILIDQPISQQLGYQLEYKIKSKSISQLKISLEFFGWLGEPSIQIQLKNRKRFLEICYDPSTRKWIKVFWREFI